MYVIYVKRLYKTMRVIKGIGDLRHGSGWSGWLPTHLDGSLLLMASDFIIWLQMAHMAPKLPKMANMAQYGSLWPIGVYAAPYGYIWLFMALIATFG